MMSLYGLPPMFLAASLLLCADPISGGTTEEADLAADLSEVTSARVEVVASSPVPAGVHVGSHYGYRISTRTHVRTFHAGADFLVPHGTPVFAVRSGVVEAVAHERDRRSAFAGYGNAVVVHHLDTDRWSLYAHLDEVFVQEGQRVDAGAMLGRVGNTTNRRFPGMVSHLHLEVRVARPDGGSPFPGPYRRHNIDPEEWLADLGVRFEQDPDCVLHEGEADVPAPMLVVREIDPGPVAVASLPTTHL